MWWSKTVENVCGIPKSLVSLSLVYNTFNFVVLQRGITTVWVFCLCVSVARLFFLFFRRGMSDSSVVCCFSCCCCSWCSFALALTVFRLIAALIFTGRGHYQLIDYFDCYLIPRLVPPWKKGPVRNGGFKTVDVGTECVGNLNTQLFHRFLHSELLPCAKVQMRVLSLINLHHVEDDDGFTSARLCVRTCSIDGLCIVLRFSFLLFRCISVSHLLLPPTAAQ